MKFEGKNVLLFCNKGKKNKIRRTEFDNTSIDKETKNTK